MVGDILFVNNTAKSEGGAILIDSTVTFIAGNIAFIDNHATGRDGIQFDYAIGGAISLRNYMIILSGIVSFVNNTANVGGGGGLHVSLLDKWTTFMFGSILFANNSAIYGAGGAISTWGGATVITGNTSFTNNSAFNYGGAIYDGSSTFDISGNIIFREDSVHVYSIGWCSIFCWSKF